MENISANIVNVAKPLCDNQMSLRLPYIKCLIKSLHFVCFELFFINLSPIVKKGGY